MPKIKVNKKSVTKKVQKGGEQDQATNKQMLGYINKIKDIYINRIKCGNEEDFNKEKFDNIDKKIKTCNLQSNQNEGTRTFNYSTVIRHINELYEDEYKDTNYDSKPISTFYNYLISELKPKSKSKSRSGSSNKLKPASGIINIPRILSRSRSKSRSRISKSNSGTILTPASGPVDLNRGTTHPSKSSSSNKHTKKPAKKGWFW